jgi:RNA polymerase sigma factor (sigma-70 family)
MEFLMQHLNAAYNLARWLMCDDTLAEGVVQDAYLTASSQFAGFQSVDGRLWLLTIVHNRCYDHLRLQETSGQTTHFDWAVHSSAQQTPNSKGALPLTEKTKAVTKSLAELTAEYREVLVLRELEQLSYREIAKIVGIPLSAAMTRLSRARQELRQTLLGCMQPMHIDLNDSGNASAITA